MGPARYDGGMRVVSLLPSATELLCAVGGEGLLVGRSHECDHPPSVTRLPALTAGRSTATVSAAIDAQVRDALADEAGGPASLYTLDGELLADLRPDVILTQDLCAVCSIHLDTVRAAAAGLPGPPRIVSLNPASVEDVLEDLLTVGDAVGRRPQANAAMVALRERYFSALNFVNAYAPRPQVAFLEWMDPLFVGGHWTPQLIEAAGGRHSLNPPGAVSRQITAEDLVSAQPERLIICPCGYDLEAVRRELDDLTGRSWWRALPAVTDRRVVMVDGNAMFNRPGPRLVDAVCWLVGWINDRPEVMPPSFPAAPVTRPGH